MLRWQRGLPLVLVAGGAVVAMETLAPWVRTRAAPWQQGTPLAGDVGGIALVTEARADPGGRDAEGVGARVTPNLVAVGESPALTPHEPVLHSPVVAHVSPSPDAAAASQSLLEQAIRDGTPAALRQLLDRGASPNAISREGQPLLALAVALGRPEVTTVLLDAGVDVDAVLVTPASEEFLAIVPGSYPRYYLTKDDGITPLMLAVLRGDREHARMLMARGASLGPTRRLSKWPLGMAANRHDLPMMQVLL